MCINHDADDMDEDEAPLHDQNALQAAQTMLLLHLSLSAQAGDAASATAVTFTTCRMFFEEVRGYLHSRWLLCLGADTACCNRVCLLTHGRCMLEADGYASPSS